MKETHPQTEIHVLMGGNAGFWSRSIRLGDQWFIAQAETLLGFSMALLGDEHSHSITQQCLSPPLMPGPKRLSKKTCTAQGSNVDGNVGQAACMNTGGNTF